MGIIISQLFTKDLTNETITKKMKELKERLKGAFLRAFYTDKCCSDRNFIWSIFGDGTKVILDVFHFLDRIGRVLSKKIPQRAEFMSKFSNVFFDLSDNELARLFEYALVIQNQGRTIAGANGMTISDMSNLPQKFIRKYGMRSIPEAARLIERYDEFVDWYKDQDWVSDDVLETLKKQRKHVQNGCLSDPLSVDGMYHACGQKRFTKRGTNCLESFHSQLKGKLTFNNMAMPLADILIKAFTYSYNERRWHNVNGLKLTHCNGLLKCHLKNLFKELFPHSSQIPYTDLHFPKEVSLMSCSIIESLIEDEAVKVSVAGKWVFFYSLF